MSDNIQPHSSLRNRRRPHNEPSWRYQIDARRSCLFRDKRRRHIALNSHLSLENLSVLLSSTLCFFFAAAFLSLLDIHMLKLLLLLISYWGGRRQGDWESCGYLQLQYFFRTFMVAGGGCGLGVLVDLFLLAPALSGGQTVWLYRVLFLME
jgi:hypothetical protein